MSRVWLEEEARRAFDQIRKNPRRLLDKLNRVPDILRARLLFRGADLGFGVSAGGRVRVQNPAGLTIGNQATFLGGMVPSEVRCVGRGTIRIGSGVVLNYGVFLEAESSIEIGDRCMVASFVHVSDRLRGKVAPIHIGADVWIAHGAIIEPGVHIGDGSVVSAGSVVVRDVPPNSLAIGNPARAIALDVVAR